MEDITIAPISVKGSKGIITKLPIAPRIPITMQKMPKAKEVEGNNKISSYSEEKVKSLIHKNEVRSRKSA